MHSEIFLRLDRINPRYILEATCRLIVKKDYFQSHFGDGFHQGDIHKLRLQIFRIFDPLPLQFAFGLH